MLFCNTSQNKSNFQVRGLVIFCTNFTKSANGQTDKYINGCIIHVDIMTGEKLSSIYVAIFPVIYWSVRSSSRRGGHDAKRGGWDDQATSKLQVSLY